MASKKKRHAIAEAEVAQVFDDACIDRLAKISKLPPTADRARFSEGVRDAARIYARDARLPTSGELHDEIEKLYRAARSRQCEEAAELCKQFSPRGIALLQARLRRPGPRAAGLRLPTAEELRDPQRSDDACVMIERLCCVGGRYRKGRKRPSGKRSITWDACLHAPVPVKHPAKRGPELDFIMHLQLTWFEATGAMPSISANAARVGPFGRMVSECLKLAGANYAHAAKLINELNMRRSKMQTQLNDWHPVNPQR